jgi:archaellum component FlaD/FlaE
VPARPSPNPRPVSRAARLLHRFTTGVTAVALLLLGAPAVLGGTSASTASGPTPPVPPASPAPAAPEAPAAPAGQEPGRTHAVPSSAGPLELASHRKKHPDRKIRRYRVRRGDTPTEIAVRYHAWTDELIRMNHGPTLYAGEIIRIPVVVEAVRACDEHRHHRSNLRKHKSHGASGQQADKHEKKRGKADKVRPKTKKKAHTRSDRPKKDKPKHDKPKHKGTDKKKADKKRDRWKGENASRAKVRRVVIRTAEKLGVDPDLALAVAWMESGWQQKRVSSAGALGVMQVMPGTGDWMSVMVGRKLHLRHLGDNVVAGVTLLDWLRSEAKLKVAVAGYYQGLAGVRRDGMYRSTKKYVADVLALKKRIARGWDPS